MKTTVRTAYNLCTCIDVDPSFVQGRLRVHGNPVNVGANSKCPRTAVQYSVQRTESLSDGLTRCHQRRLLPSLLEAENVGTSWILIPGCCCCCCCRDGEGMLLPVPAPGYDERISLLKTKNTKYVSVLLIREVLSLEATMVWCGLYLRSEPKVRRRGEATS